MNQERKIKTVWDRPEDYFTSTWELDEETEVPSPEWVQQPLPLVFETQKDVVDPPRQ